MSHNWDFTLLYCYFYVVVNFGSNANIDYRKWKIKPLSDYLASSIEYVSLMFIGLSCMTDCHFDFLIFSWIRTT